MKVVVTGTSRGIGLGLVRLALAEGHAVAAVARDPQSNGLKGLAREHKSNLMTLALDVCEASAGEKLTSGLSAWDCVDLLVNNAGMLTGKTDTESFLQSFRTNSIAPFHITTALLPKLKKSKNPKVAMVTSRMGSIADAKSGGYYAYRSSKAALNMINMCLSQDNPWLTAVVVHPGWVKTAMGGAGAPVEVEDSAQGIWKLLSQPLESGHFYDFRGEEIPW
jgi:NAD(P)-dependent dehydrogenase (short-subunit alcohol dehydrogenase family)